jgi:hypothetical protein
MQCGSGSTTLNLLNLVFIIHGHVSWPRSCDCEGGRFRNRDCCILSMVSLSCCNQLNHHNPSEPPQPLLSHPNPYCAITTPLSHHNPYLATTSTCESPQPQWAPQPQRSHHNPNWATSIPTEPPQPQLSHQNPKWATTSPTEPPQNQLSHHNLNWAITTSNWAITTPHNHNLISWLLHKDHSLKSCTGNSELENWSRVYRKINNPFLWVWNCANKQKDAHWFWSKERNEMHLGASEVHLCSPL